MMVWSSALASVPCVRCAAVSSGGREGDWLQPRWEGVRVAMGTVVVE